MPDAIWIIKVAALGLIALGTPVVCTTSFRWRRRGWKIAAGTMVVAYVAAVTILVVLGREPDSAPFAAAIIMLMLSASGLAALLCGMSLAVGYIRSLRSVR
jgi:hypothetical protein